MRTVADLPMIAKQVTRAVKGADAAAVKEATAVIGAAAKRSVATVVTSGRLRGVGTDGAAVGVRVLYSARPSPRGAIAAKGPLHLIEFDNRPHRIVPKRGSALSFGGRAVASVAHPGTKGKHPFGKGIAEGVAVGKRAGAAAAAAHVARSLR
jgi:hypothetical protein